jgi:hypothetical protein
MLLLGVDIGLIGRVVDRLFYATMAQLILKNWSDYILYRRGGAQKEPTYIECFSRPGSIKKDTNPLPPPLPSLLKDATKYLLNIYFLFVHIGLYAQTRQRSLPPSLSAPLGAFPNRCVYVWSVLFTFLGIYYGGISEFLCSPTNK